MSRGHGQVRQSQVITTYGPGALIDLPNYAAIIAGLDTWPSTNKLDEIEDSRLSRLIQNITEVRAPRMYAPPPQPSEPWVEGQGIGAWTFPEWFIVQESNTNSDGSNMRSRRLVHRKALERNRYEGIPVVPTRFVRACPRGHVDDLDWVGFVHRDRERCTRQLTLNEQGTSGDLSDLIVRCECGESRRLYEATEIGQIPLGICRGKRPWLGLDTEEECSQPSRLLIRTASNAYFAQVVSALSLPDRGSAIERVVFDLRADLAYVDNQIELEFMKKKPEIAEKLEPFSDDEVLKAIEDFKQGRTTERPVKEAEIDAILAAPEGYGEDIPVNPNFHARRLPETAWRKPGSGVSVGIESVIQLHRLREVQALIGFTRLEAESRDIHGEYSTDVERADIAEEPRWFPAVENRGEGVFVHLNRAAVEAWLGRPRGSSANRLTATATRSLAAGPTQATSIPRRPLHHAAHARAPPDWVTVYAMRLPRQFHQRTHLRRKRRVWAAALHRHTRCRGNPRRVSPTSAPPRRTSLPRFGNRAAVLERPNLRPACSQRRLRAALAARRRLPRLRSDRRDVLRDAQRLP